MNVVSSRIPETRQVWKSATRLLCLLVLASAAGLLTVAQTFAPGTLRLRPPRTLEPEFIEGPWEITSASGVDGVFFKIESFHPDLRVFDPHKPIDKKIVSQEIEVRVYHRQQGKETRGWFPTTTPSRFTLDGGHLGIHALFSYPTEIKSLDLDVMRAADGKTWTGTSTRDGHTLQVVLERPHPAQTAKVNSFVGDWEGEDLPEDSLHIRQSSDGTLTAWMDRTLGGVDQRNGEPLLIQSVTQNTLILATASPGGAPFQYRGSLLNDGQELTGAWAMAIDHGPRLNASVRFRRKR